jgi:formate/nitrite transporter FocA (FNT family)
MIAVVVIGIAILLLLSIPYVKNEEGKKGKIVYAVFYIAAFILCVVYESGIKFPSPLLAIGNLMRAVGLYYH